MHFHDAVHAGTVTVTAPALTLQLRGNHKARKQTEWVGARVTFITFYQTSYSRRAAATFDFDSNFIFSMDAIGIAFREGIGATSESEKLLKASQIRASKMKRHALI